MQVHVCRNVRLYSLAERGPLQKRIGTRCQCGFGWCEGSQQKTEDRVRPPTCQSGRRSHGELSFPQKGSRSKEKTRSLAGRISKVHRWGAQAQPSVTTTNVRGFSLPRDKNSRFGKRTKPSYILCVSDTSQPSTGRRGADGELPRSSQRAGQQR